MQLQHFVLIALVCAGSGWLTGCCRIDAHGHVYREWSRRMSEMGIFPVYPPREDVVVGDVYALPLHPYDTATVGYIGGLGNAGIHVEYLGDQNLGWTNFLTKLERYYRTRPYPADSTTAIVGATNAPFTRMSGCADEANRTSAFSPGSTNRLRQVSFPDFTVTHIDQESLSAVVPIEGIMASLNFNHSDIKAVHFSIPHAESYGMTTEEALQEVYQDRQFTNFQGSVYLLANSNGVISVAGAQLSYAMFQDIIRNVSQNPDYCIPWNVRRHMRKSVEAMQGKIYLALITEVYFARSMDITIDRKTATGASGAARPVSTAELKDLKDLGLLAVRSHTNLVRTTNITVSGGSTNIVTGTRAEIIDVSQGDSAYELARKLRTLEVNDSVSNIGGSVRVVSVSTGNIGLRRTFERPICVGVRGVLIKVDVAHPKALGASGRKEWLKVEGIVSLAEPNASHDSIR